MNTMQAAFKTAAERTNSQIPLPGQKERIWHWLKDNPHKTEAEIAATTHITATSIPPTVREMIGRGMLQRRRGSRFGRGVWEYATLGMKYELRPLPSKSKSLHGVKSANPAPAPATTPTTPAVQAPSPAPAPQLRAFDMDSYTLGELRSIYAQLHKLFA